MDIKNLTPEQKKALLQELEAEQQNEANRIAEGRKAYKELVNETIPQLFEILKHASNTLADAKAKVFEGVSTLVEMKADVYGRDEDQFTHSFTTEKGISLILGYRTTDSWDDTITAGLAKIDAFIKRMIKDDDTAFLVGMINELLTRDRKGNLNSKNVLKLRKKAQEHGDKEFIDGVNIVMDAWIPIKGRTFITAIYKDEKKDRNELPLDITSVELKERQSNDC